MSRVGDLKEYLPLQFVRGIAIWERGGPMPEKPSDDDYMSEHSQLWIGYMLARGVDWMERRENARICGASDKKIENLPFRG